MIIRGADGNDEQRISEMEDRLCRKYRLSRKLLYRTLAHADFHRMYKDPAKYWSIPCYAAFSGKVLTHNLAHGPLNALLGDFARGCEAHRRSWDSVGFELFKNEGPEVPERRQFRDHVAIAHRYACVLADDYIFPDEELAGKLTEVQLVELNDYLDFVSKECPIPAGKMARLAAKRQLEDLARSRRAFQK
jgi:hypothetical protein